MFSKKMINEILKKQLNSLDENKEESFVVCNNNVKAIDSSWNGKELHAKVNTSIIQKSCNNTRAYIGHTHILNTHKPSKEDFIATDNLKGIDGICVAGVDGVGCYDKASKKRIFYEPWDEHAQAQFTEHGILTWEGDSLFCDGNGDFFCEIVDKNNKVEQIGLFKNVVVEGGTNYLHPIDADFTTKTHTPNEKIKCAAKNGNDTLYCQILRDDD